MNLVASFDGDGVGLTFVFGDGGVNAVYDVGTDGGFEDGGEGDGGAIGRCGSWGENVDLGTSCLHEIEVSENFRGFFFINASITNPFMNESNREFS